jgi:hypothetical protein
MRPGNAPSLLFPRGAVLRGIARQAGLLAPRSLYSLTPSHPVEQGSGLGEVSSLVTAAGPRRHHTGFPIKLIMHLSHTN